VTGRTSSHLTALAATALEAVPVVSPRRRSRFEPGRDAIQDVGLPPEEIVSKVVSPVRENLAQPVATPLPSREFEASSRLDSPPVPVRPSSTDPAAATPARRPDAEAPHPAAEPLPRNLPGLFDVPRPAPVRVVPGSVDPLPVAPSREEPALTEHAFAPRPHGQRGEVEPAQLAVGVLMPRPLPTTAPAPVATAPAAVSRNVSPPAEPDVRVTIGRLEVRAAPSARTPEPSRRAPAGLRSLEEYDAARGGGRR